MNVETNKMQQKYLADKLKDSVIAITGATGLVGSRIAFYLLELNKIHGANIKVLAFVRNKDKYNKCFSNYAGQDEIEFVHYDECSDINYNHDVDYIIHCAGISGGTKLHLTEPTKISLIAYESTKKILDFAVNNHCKKLCYISTYEIYGGISQIELIREDEPCFLDTMTLRNIYSECKRMCEAMCVAYNAQFNIEIVCGRLTSTFGYGVKYNDPRFFAEFARCAVEKRDIVLKSAGRTVRSYLDSDDAASAFLYLLTDGKNCNIYNVTNMENSISIKEIAEKVIALSNENIKLRFDISDDISSLGFRKEGCTLMDAHKLYALGWKPVYSIDETILKLICTIRGGYNQ